MKKTLISILIISINLYTANTYDINEYENLINSFSKNPFLQKSFDDHLKYLISIDPNYFDYKPNVNFDCDIDYSKDDPSKDNRTINVHTLKPSDIKVIAALGDSITAGVGIKAHTPIGVLVENRESSWSIGGEKTLEKVLTLPNILKKFSKDLKGYATIPTVPLSNISNDLDVAVSGAKAQDIPAQARKLINLMKKSKEIDFENDWKLVTLFIGGNDLCQYCKGEDNQLPKNYINNIQKGLDILHAELPKTLVNFVNILNIVDIKDMNKGLACIVLHQFECKCGSYPKSSQDSEDLFELFRNYTSLSEKLVSSGRYDTKEDFTVVHQPFFEDFLPPRLKNGQIDLTFFAPDCFHFSGKSHALAGMSLWNNMLQRVGQKNRTFDIYNETIMCPTKEQPYIFTNKNSYN